MAVRIVKCKYCGIQFDRNAEPAVEVSARRYAHKACADKYQEKASQDELDYAELEKYIKKLFNLQVVNAKIKKQIRDFRQEYNYTYSGMLKTLYWWFEIRGNSIEQAQGGIGIIPYVYNDACQYYYSIYLAEMANKGLTIYKPEVKEIEIGSPRTKPNPTKLFNLGDE